MPDKTNKKEEVYLKTDIILEFGKTLKKGTVISLPSELVKKFKAKGFVCDPTEAEEDDTRKAPSDSVLDILDGNVKAVKKALPSQTDEDLSRLLDAEKKGKPRSTITEAIEAEQASRQEPTEEEKAETRKNLTLDVMAAILDEGKEVTDGDNPRPKIEEINERLELDEPVTKEERDDLMEELETVSDKE